MEGRARGGSTKVEVEIAGPLLGHSSAQIKYKNIIMIDLRCKNENLQRKSRSESCQGRRASPHVRSQRDTLFQTFQKNILV